MLFRSTGGNGEEREQVRGEARVWVLHLTTRAGGSGIEREEQRAPRRQHGASSATGATVRRETTVEDDRRAPPVRFISFSLF